MLMLQFSEYEYELISKLQNTKESCQEYLDHYKSLTPKEAAIAGRMVAAAGKQYPGLYSADCDIIDPFESVERKRVNNGWGEMIAINPDCFFFPEDVTLFYVRDTMWLPEHHKGEPVPRWIEDMAHDMRCFSSGLADIKPEIIQFTFDNEPPCDYYAITFRLSKEKVKRRIKLADEVFYMENTGNYILTLSNIMGEYDACFGQLLLSGPVVLLRDSIFFK